ncbi:response regulator transcription factor [Thermoclostridium caenicola]|uniref:Stage 0 sporulation protein A homolog n=1 Tax=Thermoclostridium caenicola TaxID=659425 RepID=A0A1M6CG08_9FIRM|nr:response regulator transcription factor [Thermoclostridium caenicola]SHI59970.1 two-component system, OmpR family, response regulator/two-component system, OmpR family, response regulator VicR [Thermoclostridium caenicola]HOL85377.1 response regulator transcription factor [Thermoclostridium caenicola]HPO77862.1 response regulator transcription factor [Thermoclostridium caenicola]
MARILVVDDETAILELVEMILKREQFSVAVASTGKKALELFESFVPDLVILDLMLPDISGHDLCREMTGRRRTPIIMLTARDDIVDKVLGLELGADDYITKPFDARELVARVKAVLRRLRDERAAGPEVVRHHELVIDLDNRTVYKNDRPVELTLKEYELLEVFARNPRRVFSREELLSKAWGYDFMGDTRAVDTCITRLRKKIEDDSANPRHIITVYGFGYRFGGS